MADDSSDSLFSQLPAATVQRTLSDEERSRSRSRYRKKGVVEKIQYRLDKLERRHKNMHKEFHRRIESLERQQWERATQTMPRMPNTPGLPTTGLLPTSFGQREMAAEAAAGKGSGSKLG